MIPISEFKKHLEDRTKTMSEKDIELYREKLDLLADVCFDRWIEKLNNSQKIKDKV